jgi:ADP-heptose:LPS heptosyltransferase
LVLRWGAFGDHIQSTPVIRALKNDGYHVTVHTSERGLPVYKNNPHIDGIIEYKDDTVKQKDLESYWKELGSHYDKFVNLSGIVEGGLLKSEAIKDSGVDWPKEQRHAECNKNYSEEMLRHAGYTDFDNLRMNGELFPTIEEASRIGGFIRNKFKNKFVILWSLAGSSYHKAYPWAEWVALKFLNRHEDAYIITVGDEVCQILEWEHPRTLSKSGVFDIRTSLLLTKYVNLVVGTETGVLNAAGCFDTPKIVLLSHSTHENLTKYWMNVVPLHANVPCYPCHILHYTRRSCPCDRITGAPACMVELDKMKVFDEIERIYQRWKRKQI